MLAPWKEGRDLGLSGLLTPRYTRDTTQADTDEPPPWTVSFCRRSSVSTPSCFKALVPSCWQVLNAGFTN